MITNDDRLLSECGLLAPLEVLLSWAIIAYRVMYYRPDLVHKSWHKLLIISDHAYDALEQEYKDLMDKNRPLDSYTTDMVDVDVSRPSVRLTIGRLSKPMPSHLMS